MSKNFERLFEHVLEALTDGVWICDASARLVWINSACEKLNDIKREQVCGKTVAELLDNGNFDTDVTHRVVDEGKPVSIIQKVRSGRTLLVSGVPIFGPSGEIECVVGDERDLTELLALEEELELSKQVNSRISSELSRAWQAHARASEIIANTLHQARSHDDVSLKESRQRAEHAWLERACRQFKRQVDIAKMLDVSQATVARLMKKHNIYPDKHQH